jgi:hypothetical protein
MPTEIIRLRVFFGALTCSNDIVHNQDLLAGLDGVLLHLEEILAVLLLVGGGLARAGELALLADGHEAGAETKGEGGSEKETPSIQAYDDIGLLVLGELENLELEGAEQKLVDLGVLEERQDVDEDDAGDGEVVEGAQLLLERYLCTGEFGGTGGGGGGLSSRGILAGGSLAVGQGGGFSGVEDDRLFGLGNSLVLCGGHVGGKRRRRGKSSKKAPVSKEKLVVAQHSTGQMSWRVCECKTDGIGSHRPGGRDEMSNKRHGCCGREKKKQSAPCLDKGVLVSSRRGTAFSLLGSRFLLHGPDSLVHVPRKLPHVPRRRNASYIQVVYFYRPRLGNKAISLARVANNIRLKKITLLLI